MPPLNRRAFLRTLAGGLAGAAVPDSVAKAAKAITGQPSLGPVENLSANEWRELPAHLNSGFKFMGDGYANYYPHNHGPIGIGGDWVGANGQPPMWVDPPTMFDEVTQKEADDLLQQLRDVNYSVPGNDTDPATGLVHSRYRFNRHTGQWHPHYIREVRPNVFRDVYLEPGAPVPKDFPSGIIDPVQRAYEDNPLWMHEEWPEWTTQGKDMLLEGRRRFLQNMAEDWRRSVESDPETHRRNMETDPEYRKSYESTMEQVSRARGGRHNLGPNPLLPHISQLTGNMGLPGDTPSERTGRIRRLLAMGVPIAAATAMASQASASEPQDKGMIPVEGKPGTFAFPDDIDAVDAFPAEDLRFQRATPVPYPTRDEAFQMYRSGLLHSAQEDGMAMARASAAYEQQYDSVVGQRTKELVAQGVDPVNAELRATKEFELGRPTIRKAGGGAMSPNEFLANFVVQNAGQFGVPEDQISGAVDMARQYVTSGGYGSELDKAAHQMLLGILEANAPQGFESDRSGIGQEELDRLRQKYGDNANFMYPDWQRTNFDALRQYELLSHGTDLFEPGHASNEVLKVAGGVFNPEGPFGGSFTKGYTPDTPEGDALYWYKLSRNTGSQEPGYHSYRDPDTNDARFWKHSTTTLSGLLSGGLSGEDTSRRYGRAAAYTMPLGQNPTVPAWQRQLLTDVRTNTNRDVPVIPTNKTPQQMSQAKDLVEAYDKSARDWLPTAYRRTFRQHPTQFQSMLFGLIHDSTDPATAVDAAVSVAGGGALGAYRNVAKNAGKGVARSIAKGAATGVAGAVPRHLAEEASYGAGQSALLSPISALVTPDTDNPLAQREDGSFAQPTDRDFDAVTGINTGNWRDVLGKASSQYYGKTK